MDFNLQTAIIFILCINLVLFVGGVRVVEGGFLDNMVDTNDYTVNGTITVNEDFRDAVPDNFESTGATDTLSFIDVLKAIKSFLIFMVNIIFTPIGLFVDLPAIAGLIFGVPLMVGGVVAFLYFVRSGR